MVLPGLTIVEMVDSDIDGDGMRDSIRGVDRLDFDGDGKPEVFISTWPMFSPPELTVIERNR